MAYLKTRFLCLGNIRHPAGITWHVEAMNAFWIQQLFIITDNLELRN